MQMEPRGYVPAPTTPTFQSSKFLSMASTSPSPCCKPIVQGVLALSLKSEADVHERALAAAHANSLFGLLAQWIEDGMKTSPEAIAATLCELYQSRMRRM
ncbi:MAG: TetR-like C-terminal domain-containing protein [Atopobiaceae bacterium]